MTAFLERRAISLTAWKSPFGGDRETGLDDVDAHVVEHLGDLELFLKRHGGAGALFAVAQGGVEYNEAVLFRTYWLKSSATSFGSVALCLLSAEGFSVAVSNP